MARWKIEIESVVDGVVYGSTFFADCQSPVHVCEITPTGKKRCVSRLGKHLKVGDRVWPTASPDDKVLTARPHNGAVIQSIGVFNGG